MFLFSFRLLLLLENNETVLLLVVLLVDAVVEVVDVNGDNRNEEGWR